MRAMNKGAVNPLELSRVRNATERDFSRLTSAIFTEKFEHAVPRPADITNDMQYYALGLQWLGTEGGRRAMEDAMLEAARLLNVTVSVGH